MPYTTKFSVSIPISYREMLDRLAWERTINEMRRVSISEMIREALERTYGLEATRREGVDRFVEKCDYNY